MTSKKEIVTKFKQEQFEKGKFSFKITAREEQLYANMSTVNGSSIKDISRQDLFISESNHFFSVEEMIKSQANLLINPWTNEHFTHNDLIKLRKYPQIATQLTSYIVAFESGEISDGIEKYHRYKEIMSQNQEIIPESSINKKRLPT